MYVYTIELYTEPLESDAEGAVRVSSPAEARHELVEVDGAAAILVLPRVDVGVLGCTIGGFRISSLYIYIYTYYVYVCSNMYIHTYPYGDDIAIVLGSSYQACLSALKKHGKTAVSSKAGSADCPMTFKSHAIYKPGFLESRSGGSYPF